MQRFYPVITYPESGYGDQYAIMEPDLCGDYVHISDCPISKLATITRYTPIMYYKSYSQYVEMIEDPRGEYIEFNQVG